MSSVVTQETATGSVAGEVPLAKGLINGQWVAGTGPVKDTIGPSDGTVVTRVAYSSFEQVDAAVAAAKAAQRAWAHVPLSRRAQIMAAGIDAIEERAEEIARWVTIEMGKTINEARDEVVTSITVPAARAAIEDARRFAGRVLPAFDSAYENRRVQVIHQPIGVTAFISPWNFPVEMIGNCVASLMMGNACVWKPSEWAPLAPQLITEAFISAGLPAGLLNLVYGGPEVGEHLVTHDDVGLIAFIGSTAVGEQIASAAGVKRLLLELGGNGPMVVMEDADVDAAVEAAVLGCFYQAGQVCTASERILVHIALHDEFAEKLTARARGLRVGDPLAEDTEMGPLSEQRILAKVVDHVEDARAQGATILTGGNHDGLFYEPTVLVDVTPDMTIAREETFGPVAPIIRFTTAEQALAIANDSPYGLSTSVFTRSMKTAFLMAEGLEAGAVNVNASTNDWELSAPFGGWKKSGIGKELGEDMLRAFVNTKSVTFDLT